ncbi:putative metal-dependent membrane protease [Rubidibacter lacunae KORDI 51-2]|uniref:Putative metal-dependent membrane protease n=1 Tax=Rubidibacter lacunae KORDI 51-2 TaxID=582515 RepID=U5DMD8_9CHRO|nr:type II CAAX endopeptidase family protein [Rubidibacter lacunae]ERN42841.1 putative metal-dependent membrane protease [Rubidibacter lacunae KORDI 51-2]
MTYKRLILSLLTAFAVLRVFLSLGSSLGQPQIQSRLELYQVDLALHVAALRADDGSDTADLVTLRESLVGDAPYVTALEKYQSARAVTVKTLDSKRSRRQELIELGVESEALAPLDLAIADLQRFIASIDLNLGLIRAQQGKTDDALLAWAAIGSSNGSSEAQAFAGATLTQLWQEPPHVEIAAETALTDVLDGWFRYRALQRLYLIQERVDDVKTLQARERALARAAAARLVAISALPGLGGLLGLGLLLFVLGQRLVRGRESLLATKGDVVWKTPWDWEITWQVLVGGFFTFGLLVLPLAIQLLGINIVGWSARATALFSFGTYAVLAAGGLGILWVSIRAYLPLPEEWFVWRGGNWLAWGIGGYLVAIPLVTFVSLINQQIWQGQGGSNPLLFAIVETQDRLALAIYLLTASAAAPLFEELIFRGFLLPSLTRYMSVWSAIALSAAIFSIAHLSLAEMLPLATLGLVLGVVYTRSRNLLAPMVLHGLWNGGTLLGLYLLGSGID